MKILDTYQIMEKLIGPIDPIGETNTDNARLDNLVEFMILTQKMVQKVKEISRNQNRVEYSIKRTGEYAEHCLKHIREDIED